MPEVPSVLARFACAAALSSLLAAAASARPNLIQNGRFDTSVSGWTAKNSLSWITNDSGGALGSGVARITNASPFSAVAGSSCATVEPGEDLVVGGKLWVAAGTAGDNAYVGVNFYGSDDCDHQSGGSSEISAKVTTAGWHSIARHVVVPQGLHSVSVLLASGRGAGASGTTASAFFDDVYVHRGSCAPGDGPTALCLNNDRFAVTATWTANGQTGAGVGVPLTDESGNFWFFGQNNIELDVKVLNGCGVNNRYWVFAAGLTNVKVDLTVTDTDTGVSKVYKNAAGHVFSTVTDTSAFATCP